MWGKKPTAAFTRMFLFVGEASVLLDPWWVWILKGSPALWGQGLKNTDLLSKIHGGDFRVGSGEQDLGETTCGREWKWKESIQVLRLTQEGNFIGCCGSWQTPSGGLSKGLLEQGCRILNLKLFVLLWYNPPFPESSLYKSTFAKIMLHSKRPQTSETYNKKFLFFVHGSVGLPPVTMLQAAGLFLWLLFEGPGTFSLQESILCAWSPQMYNALR